METTELTKREKKEMERKKKFVRLKEGAELYSVGMNTFRDWARDSGAAYRVGSVVLVNIELLDRYLENFRIPSENDYGYGYGRRRY